MIKENACTFLASPRKVPKEGDLRGHSEKACPLKKPLRRIAGQRPKMFRFLNAYISRTERLLHVDARKSEHFRVSDGEAAGVSKGGALARSAPLADFFGYFLVRRQESNITAPSSFLNVWIPVYLWFSFRKS